LYSIGYCIWVILLFLLLLSMNIYFKEKIKFTMILLDNLIMICILGIYEFLFFKNIVFKYMLMSTNELIKNMVDNLLKSC